MNYIKDFDFHNKNSKLAASFLIPTILFFILSPGVLFEIDIKNSEKKVNTVNKVPYATAATHSVIFGIIMFMVYYLYLSKKKQCTSI